LLVPFLSTRAFVLESLTAFYPLNRGSIAEALARRKVPSVVWRAFLFVASAFTLYGVPIIGVIFANLWDTFILAGVDVPSHCIDTLSNWGFHDTDACSISIVR
jgi:hypothetical protein